jgi:hypothetical protein
MENADVLLRIASALEFMLVALSVIAATNIVALLRKRG